jgi:hypothetical protein
MPSTNKTPQLQLNQWVAGDRLSIGDHNADNLKVDQGFAQVQTAASNASAQANRLETGFEKLKTDTNAKIDKSIRDLDQSLTQSFNNDLAQQYTKIVKNENDISSLGARTDALEKLSGNISAFKPSEYLRVDSAGIQYDRKGSAVLQCASVNDLPSLSAAVAAAGQTVAGIVAIVGGNTLYKHNGTTWDQMNLTNTGKRAIPFAGSFESQSNVILVRDGDTVTLTGVIQNGTTLQQGRISNVGFLQRTNIGIKSSGKIIVNAISYVAGASPEFVGDAVVEWEPEGNVHICVNRATTAVYVRATFVDIR